MYRQPPRRTVKQPPLPPPLPSAPPLPPPPPPVQPSPPLPGAQASHMPPQPQSLGNLSSQETVPQLPSYASSGYHRPAPNIPKLMDLNLCDPAPPICQKHPPIPSAMSSASPLQLQGPTATTPNPLHGKDIDRFEHVRPPEHAPLQQQPVTQCERFLPLEQSTPAEPASASSRDHSLDQATNQQVHVTSGTWGRDIVTTGDWGRDIVTTGDWGHDIVTTGDWGRDIVTIGDQEHPTSFDRSQVKKNTLSSSPPHSYDPARWSANDTDSWHNTSESSWENTQRQPVNEPLRWAEALREEGEPHRGWSHGEQLSNPNWHGSRQDRKYSDPPWHHYQGGVGEQLNHHCTNHLIPTPAIAHKQPHHSPPHHAVLCALEPADMCGYDAERGVYSDGTRMSLLPLPDPVGGEHYADTIRSPSLTIPQDGRSLTDGYTGLYNEDRYHWSADHVRNSLVPNEMYCERSHVPIPPPVSFSEVHKYSSSSHFESSKVPAPHYMGPAQPLFPIVPVVVRPEVRTVQADKIFELPGRKNRASHIVIILRGLPGSGKSHLAKLIKDKETFHSAAAPRVISIDSYFLTEVEKEEKDPETGRRVKRKLEEYEYDEAMEPSYRNSMFRLFVKTLEEGFFPMVVVDAVNHKVCHFDQYWSCAKMNGFEVYVAELIESIDVCAHRNIHNRTRAEIEKLAAGWDETPPHFLRMDVTTLLSDSNIDEVEMESADLGDERGMKHDANLTEQTPVATSRWEDATEDTLDKLDGFVRRKRHHSEAEEQGQELSLKEYLSKKMDSSGSSRKRVRWADMEEAKEVQRRKEIGFCIGSEWSKVSEEEATEILKSGTTTTLACELGTA